LHLIVLWSPATRKDRSEREGLPNNAQCLDEGRNLIAVVVHVVDLVTSFACTNPTVVDLVTSFACTNPTVMYVDSTIRVASL
jgi:lauroyl/myristoyl acyltransferase